METSVNLCVSKNTPLMDGSLIENYIISHSFILKTALKYEIQQTSVHISSFP